MKKVNIVLKPVVTRVQVIINGVRCNIKCLNVTRIICNHLIGEEHTTYHRFAIGGIIMYIGVSVAKIGHVLPILEIPAEIVGFLMHTIGGYPFAESAVKLGSKKQ